MAVVRWGVRLCVFLILLIAVAVLALRLAAWQRETAARAELMPAEGKLVSTTMGQVYVEELGPAQGPPVLLVHGSIGWAGFWRNTAQALASQGYRAIAFDLSPMGFSDRDPEGDYNRVRQGQRILALVEALHVKPVLLAHSFGSGPASEAVMQKGDAFEAYLMVAAAVGLNSHLHVKEMPLLLRPTWLREAAISASATNPWAMEWMLSLFLARKEAATAAQGDILRYPLRLEGTTPAIADWSHSLLVPPKSARSTRAEAYMALRLPTELIWGSEDTATPPEDGRALAGLIPNARITMLEGLGHIPQIEDPEAFQKAMFAALSRLRGG